MSSGSSLSMLNRAPGRAAAGLVLAAALGGCPALYPGQTRACEPGEYVCPDLAAVLTDGGAVADQAGGGDQGAGPSCSTDEPCLLMRLEPRPATGVTAGLTAITGTSATDIWITGNEQIANNGGLLINSDISGTPKLKTNIPLKAPRGVAIVPTVPSKVLTVGDGKSAWEYDPSAMTAPKEIVLDIDGCKNRINPLGTLYSISAITAEEIWMASSLTTDNATGIYRFNYLTRACQVMADPTGAATIYLGVAGQATPGAEPRDYAVVTTGLYETALRWGFRGVQGAATPTRLGGDLSRATYPLRGAAMDGSGQAFIVGDSASFYVADTRGAVRVAVPAALAEANLIGVAARSGEVWLVGSRPSGGVIARYVPPAGSVGARWAVSTTDAALRAVYSPVAGEAWAVGDAGTIIRASN